MATNTLAKGVVAEDIVDGVGIECPRGAIVTVHYRGTLKSNGKEFDSSFGGDPVKFPLNQLIEGWQIGIPGMKPGGKRTLTLPWNVGYGEHGAPPDIPGKADLVFEIELISFR